MKGVGLDMKKFALIGSALALAAAPVALQAQAADRAVAPVSGESELGEGNDTILAIVGLAVLAGFIVLTATNDDDLPTSP